MIKQSIQDKVDEIMKMATTPAPIQNKTIHKNQNDSLLKVIRTQSDADRFRADLNAAVTLSKKMAADKEK